MKVSFVVWGTKRLAPCVCSEIYHRVDHPMNEYLNHFVAARNTRASAALCELAFVIERNKSDEFSRSFLAAAVHSLPLLRAL